MAASWEQELLFSEDSLDFVNVCLKFADTKPSAADDDISLIDNGRRILLVGKTGSGKSTLGNRILDKPDVHLLKKNKQSAESSSASAPEGEDAGFVVETALNACTKQSCFKVAFAWGRNQKVTDTPGLFDPSKDLENTLEQVAIGLGLCSPGPHAILFLIRCDGRFTPEEEQTFHEIRKVFGDGVERHMILVFTHGECLDASGRTIEDLLEGAPENLRKIMDIVGDNYVMVKSLTTDSIVHQKQMRNLFAKIDKVAEQGFYTKPDFRPINRAVARAVKQVMKRDNLTAEKAEVAVKNGLAKKDPRFLILLKVLVLLVLAAPFFAVLGVFTLVTTASWGFAAIEAIGAALKAGFGDISNLSLSKFVEKIKAFVQEKNSRRQTACSVM